MASFERGQRGAEPEKIGDIEVRLFNPDPTGRHAEHGNQARVLLQVVNTDGSIKEVTGDLADHVPAATMTQIWNMMANLRTKAETEILPV